MASLSWASASAANSSLNMSSNASVPAEGVGPDPKDDDEGSEVTVCMGFAWGMCLPNSPRDSAETEREGGRERGRERNRKKMVRGLGTEEFLEVLKST